MKRVLVAGATGYLGGFVARECKARGHFVRALARTPDKLTPLRASLDEVVRGEVTRPETLAGVCEGLDVVFSSVGITRQKDGLTFRDVDYQGNKNLLVAAQRAGVRRFVYVSVFHGPRLRHLAIVDAHECLVEALKASGMDYAVVRPTGYFSDLEEVLQMARRGRVYLLGHGRNKANPIHGADLAVVCVDAVEGERREIDVGGPEVLTAREIAHVAFLALDKPVRVAPVPVWLMRAVVAVTRLFSRHQADLLAFFTTVTTIDMVAPTTGTRTLEAHYRSVVGARRGS
jgi:uncharacterized protein YbjT (DUF2867 family)